MLYACKYRVVVGSEVITIDLKIAAHASDSAYEGFERTEAGVGAVDETARVTAHRAIEVSQWDDSHG